jgi:Porphyromonas-type peptidyl-arginine deiminase
MRAHGRLQTMAPWLLATAMATVPGPCAGDVVLEPVPPSARWADAVEPGALRLACARSDTELKALFESEGLPFRPEILRREPARVCHVFCRPTVPGFRASPDDDPVTEILFDTDPVLYLTEGSRNRGEPVGVMREILQRIARPLAVSILIHRVHAAAAYEAATRRNFGGTPHRIALLDRGVERTFWWVQDYVKAGTSSRGPTLLIPRRIFEGSVETAEAFDPLLARFARQERVVRSRLSWEGGDLQFTRDPRDPRRLVLYHGSFAKPYWAETLTPQEFEYVLALEFGADRAVDLGGLAPHVDYFVSFLPRAGTALVGVPVSGDFAVARAALDALLARFAGARPEALVELRDQLSSPHADLVRAGQALERARRQQVEWQLAVDPTLPEHMRSLVRRVCPEGGDCLSPANQLRLIEADPDTFGSWVRATQSARDEPAVIAAHLDVVEGQLEPVPETVRRRALEKVGELEAMGFRVVRVPAFRVDLNGPRDWPGISYVNALVVDQQVFVPRFGLGDVEDRLVHDVGAQLPAGYSIVPVDAQRVLIRNGGLHCLAGLVR